MIMNIVIIGAGDIGCYIASLLSQEQHNVILIDKDGQKLQEATFNMDVATRVGSGTDWQLLDDLLELSPHIFLAMTNDDETNLVACTLAKHLGYPRTIARVRDSRFLNKTRLDFGHLFDVDYFISPELLMANDILKSIINPASVAVETFAHGAVQMRTLAIPTKWRKVDKPLKALDLPSGVIVGLISREVEEGVSFEKTRKIIFPHGEDHIYPGDEVTFIGEADVVSEVHAFFGLEEKPVHSVVIVGGSLTGINLAKLLSHQGVKVILLEKDHAKCLLLADILPKCNVINHDATDFTFYKAENLGEADAIVACTSHDEINLLSAMLGKEAGCPNSIIMLANSSYSPYVGRFGIDHVISRRVCVANHILSQILSGTITSLVSLYDNRAEIIEINISMESKLVGIPLSELGPLLPKDFLIAVIQNRGRIMIANGNRIISPGDTVIVLTSPKHMRELEKIF
jgi:trk system potassium uptake protein